MLDVSDSFRRLCGALLLSCCGMILVLVGCEIEQKLAWIGWVGTEAQTADRTSILARPYAFAFPV